jgi:hypothetical protein
MHLFKGSRLLESDSDANDFFPAKAAFLIAGVIWLLILVFVIVVVLSAMQHSKERDLQLSWRQKFGRYFSQSDDIGSVGSDISVQQTAALDSRFNLQTILLALVQASFSMLILGGIQLNFHLTCTIVLSVLTAWTFLSGVYMTIWMSHVAEKAVSEAKNYTSDRSLRALKVEMHKNPLSFLSHYVEISFLRPMVNLSQMSAGDIYQDFGRDEARTFLLGVGQLILLCMYTLSIIDDGKPDFSDIRLYTYYCLGIFMQVSYLSGHDVLYKSFYNHLTFWGNVFCAARQGHSYTWEPPKYLLYKRPKLVLSGSVRQNNIDATMRLHDNLILRMRFVLSTAINVGGLSIITLLLPLQLATSQDPRDFVFSAVGAYYIREMDSYDEPVMYSLVTDPLPADTEMTKMTRKQR